MNHALKHVGYLLLLAFVLLVFGAQDSRVTYAEGIKANENCKGGTYTCAYNGTRKNLNLLCMQDKPCEDNTNGAITKGKCVSDGKCQGTSTKDQNGKDQKLTDKPAVPAPDKETLDPRNKTQSGVSNTQAPPPETQNPGGSTQSQPSTRPNANDGTGGSSQSQPAPTQGLKISSDGMTQTGQDSTTINPEQLGMWQSAQESASNLWDGAKAKFSDIVGLPNSEVPSASAYGTEVVYPDPSSPSYKPSNTGFYEPDPARPGIVSGPQNLPIERIPAYTRAVSAYEQAYSDYTDRSSFQQFRDAVTWGSWESPQSLALQQAEAGLRSFSSDGIVTSQPLGTPAQLQPFSYNEPSVPQSIQDFNTAQQEMNSLLSNPETNPLVRDLLAQNAQESLAMKQYVAEQASRTYGPFPTETIPTTAEQTPLSSLMQSAKETAGSAWEGVKNVTNDSWGSANDINVSERLATLNEAERTTISSAQANAQYNEALVTAQAAEQARQDSFTALQQAQLEYARTADAVVNDQSPAMAQYTAEKSAQYATERAQDFARLQAGVLATASDFDPVTGERFVNVTGLNGETQRMSVADYIAQTQPLIDSYKAEAERFQKIADFFKNNPLATPGATKAFLDGGFRSEMLTRNILKLQENSQSDLGIEGYPAFPDANSTKLYADNIKRLAGGGDLTAAEQRVLRESDVIYGRTEQERLRDNIANYYESRAPKTFIEGMLPQGIVTEIARATNNAYNSVFDPTLAQQSARLTMTSGQVLASQAFDVAIPLAEVALITTPGNRLASAAFREIGSVLPTGVTSALSDVSAGIGKVAAAPFSAGERVALREWWNAGGIMGEPIGAGATQVNEALAGTGERFAVSDSVTSSAPREVLPARDFGAGPVSHVADTPVGPVFSSEPLPSVTKSPLSSVQRSAIESVADLSGSEAQVILREAGLETRSYGVVPAEVTRPGVGGKIAESVSIQRTAIVNTNTGEVVAVKSRVLGTQSKNFEPMSAYEIVAPTQPQGFTSALRERFNQMFSSRPVTPSVEVPVARTSEAFEVAPRLTYETPTTPASAVATPEPSAPIPRVESPSPNSVGPSIQQNPVLTEWAPSASAWRTAEFGEQRTALNALADAAQSPVAQQELKSAATSIQKAQQLQTTGSSALANAEIKKAEQSLARANEAEASLQGSGTKTTQNTVTPITNKNTPSVTPAQRPGPTLVQTIRSAVASVLLISPVPAMVDTVLGTNLTGSTIAQSAELVTKVNVTSDAITNRIASRVGDTGGATGVTTQFVSRGVERGGASTYNPNVSGYKTGGQKLSTGGSYDPTAYEAAIQLDLGRKYGVAVSPDGTRAAPVGYAIVKNNVNGKELVVKINDNGPLVGSRANAGNKFRAIDLNEASMRYLSDGKLGNNSGVLPDVTVTFLEGTQYATGPIDASTAVAQNTTPSLVAPISPVRVTQASAKPLSVQFTPANLPKPIEVKNLNLENRSFVVFSGAKVSAEDVARAQAPASQVANQTPLTRESVQQTVSDLQKEFGCKGTACNEQFINYKNPTGVSPELAAWIKNRYKGATSSAGNELRAAVIIADYVSCKALGSCGTVVSANALRNTGTIRHNRSYAFDVNLKNAEQQADYATAWISATKAQGITPGIGFDLRCPNAQSGCLHVDTVGDTSGGSNAWAYGKGCGTGSSACIENLPTERLREIGQIAYNGKNVSGTQLAGVSSWGAPETAVARGPETSVGVSLMFARAPIMQPGGLASVIKSMTPTLPKSLAAVSFKPVTDLVQKVEDAGKQVMASLTGTPVSAPVATPAPVKPTNDVIAQAQKAFEDAEKAVQNNAIKLAQVRAQLADVQKIDSDIARLQKTVAESISYKNKAVAQANNSDMGALTSAQSAIDTLEVAVVQAKGIAQKLPSAEQSAVSRSLRDLERYKTGIETALAKMDTKGLTLADEAASVARSIIATAQKPATNLAAEIARLEKVGKDLATETTRAETNVNALRRQEREALIAETTASKEAGTSQTTQSLSQTVQPPRTTLSFNMSFANPFPKPVITQKMGLGATGLHYGELTVAEAQKLGLQTVVRPFGTPVSELKAFESAGINAYAYVNPLNEKGGTCDGCIRVKQFSTGPEGVYDVTTPQFRTYLSSQVGEGKTKVFLDNGDAYGLAQTKQIVGMLREMGVTDIILNNPNLIGKEVATIEGVRGGAFENAPEDAKDAQAYLKNIDSFRAQNKNFTALILDDGGDTARVQSITTALNKGAFPNMSISVSGKANFQGSLVTVAHTPPVRPQILTFASEPLRATPVTTGSAQNTLTDITPGTIGATNEIPTAVAVAPTGEGAQNVPLDTVPVVQSSDSNIPAVVALDGAFPPTLVEQVVAWGASRIDAVTQAMSTWTRENRLPLPGEQSGQVLPPLPPVQSVSLPLQQAGLFGETTPTLTSRIVSVWSNAMTGMGTVLERLGTQPFSPSSVFEQNPLIAPNTPRGSAGGGGNSGGTIPPGGENINTPAGGVENVSRIARGTPWGFVLGVLGVASSDRVEWQQPQTVGTPLTVAPVPQLPQTEKVNLPSELPETPGAVISDDVVRVDTPSSQTGTNGLEMVPADALTDSEFGTIPFSQEGVLATVPPENTPVSEAVPATQPGLVVTDQNGNVVAQIPGDSVVVDAQGNPIDITQTNYTPDSLMVKDKDGTLRPFSEYLQTAVPQALAQAQAKVDEAWRAQGNAGPAPRVVMDETGGLAVEKGKVVIRTRTISAPAVSTGSGSTFGGTGNVSSGQSLSMLGSLAKIASSLLGIFGGGSDSGSQNTQSPTQPPVVTPVSASVVLLANPPLIPSGATTRLSWASVGGTGCVVRGAGLEENVPLIGGRLSPALASTTVFSITCHRDTDATNYIRAYATTTVQ